MGGLRKIRNPQEEALEPEMLYWKMDKKQRKRTGVSTKKRKGAVPELRETKQEFVNEFFHSGHGKSLEEVVRNSLT